MPVMPTNEEIEKGKKMPDGKAILEAIINDNPSMANELYELGYVDLADDED